jgi:putative ABC transport system permease protein
VKQFGLDRDAVAQVYVPLRQSQGLAGRILVRTTDDPSRAITIIREAVRAVDPDIPIENYRTLDELREQYLATPKLTAVLLSVFAALALMVTLTGIAGVIAQSVSQRTQEFGLRMALGATGRSVLQMVVRQGLVLVALGLLIGFGVALGASRVLESYLFNTTPRDPLAFAVVGVAFLAAGVVACLGPAWRATRVDPMIALRAD